MNYVDFANALLRTEDLDPSYCVLVRSGLQDAQLAQFLVCYWCCYHFGVSSWAAEAKSAKSFWGRMRNIARNEGLRYPRASERRHFRGEAAMKLVELLEAQYKTPQRIVETWCLQEGATFKSVTETVRRSYGFGPWIAFKVADMAERVLRNKVDFSDCELGIYEEPRRGAALVMTGDADAPVTLGELQKFLSEQQKFWKNKKAPPHLDRRVGVQEIETFLCKYKSHYNGHYTVGKDITEISHALEGWGDLAQHLRKFVPALQQELF